MGLGLAGGGVRDFDPLLTLSWSGFSLVWVLPGLVFSLGFSLMVPDVEQDLDWSVAENQSKTVMDLKCFCSKRRL